jgi:hypothetical protein
VVQGRYIEGENKPCKCLYLLAAQEGSWNESQCVFTKDLSDSPSKAAEFGFVA